MLTRPCISLVTSHDAAVSWPLVALQVYWHSSAHVLGEALELHYGGLLCCSPPGDGGFHYDVYVEDRYP